MAAGAQVTDGPGGGAASAADVVAAAAAVEAAAAASNDVGGNVGDNDERLHGLCLLPETVLVTICPVFFSAVAVNAQQSVQY